MLTSIRERAQGWIAWIIISIIIMVFAVWGIQNFFTPDPNLPVIEVGATAVGLREFQFAYQQQRDRLHSMLGGAVEQSGFTDERIKQQVINDLVERIVLTNNANDLGMRVGDALLAVQIHAIDAFQVNGRFAKDRYEQVLHNQGMTPALFEQRTRATLISQQFYTGVVNTALVTTGQIDNHLRLAGQTRDIAHLAVPAARFLEGTTVSADEIQRYYDEHPDSYQVPEQVTIAYLEIAAEALAPTIEATDDELLALYEETRANYHRAERRRASHILINLDQKADATAVTAAQVQLDDLKRQIMEGAAFEELARVHSQDSGSAPQGGDLGFFGRGAMVPAFEEAAFTMKEGELSAAIRTPFGLHLIKLTGIEPANEQSFTEARSAVLQEFRRTQSEKQFFERSEILANISYEHPDSLEPSAVQLGLTIRTAGPFPKSGGTEIAANPKIIAAAFDEDVLIRGNNSNPIELADHRLAVLRVTDHQVARRQSLDEVREAVTSAVRQQLAQAQAKTLGDSLVADLRAGQDAAVVVSHAKLAWQRLGWVERKATGLSPELMDLAFRLSRPTTDKPGYAGLVLPNGDFAVVQVVGIKEGDPATASTETRDAARKQLIRATGEQNFAALIADLQAKTAVVVHKERF